MSIDTVHQVDSTGWKASLALEFSCRFGKTVLSQLKHKGPLRVQRPFYPEGDICHTYLLHPPSGLVGGDELMYDIAAKPQTHCLLTTPGSTRYYRSAGPVTRVIQRLSVDSHAIMEWLPQDNIYFTGARAQTETHIYLEKGAQFTGWEMHCLGRPANNERFLDGQMNNRLCLYREGQPQLLECLRINKASDLGSRTGMRHHPMQATMVMTGCNTTILEQVRTWLDQRNIPFPHGVTLIDDLLILRLLADRTEKMQAQMIPLWQFLRPKVMGIPAVLPRIWAT